MKARIVAGEPCDFTAEQIDLFISTLCRWGHVDNDGIYDRVTNADTLVFQYANCGALAGIAAIKNQEPDYARKVFLRAGAAMEPGPLELGWVVIRPEFRGQRLCGPMLAAAMDIAGGCPLYATTRHGNQQMRNALTRQGFVLTGQAWRSSLGDHDLVLFTRA